MKKALTIYPLLLLVLLLATACIHKDLNFTLTGEENTYVVFDWTDTRNAAPNGMTLVVFNAAAQPITTHFDDQNGGALTLPSGDYQMIAFNDNKEFVQERGDTWENYELYVPYTNFAAFSPMFATTRSIPVARGTETQKFIDQPDVVWSSAVKDINILATESRIVQMPMEEATFVVNFHIKHVDNMDYVNDAVATVSGMAESWSPSRHECSETECIIPFNLTRDGTAFKGSVRTFGYRARKTTGESEEHKLVIYAEMSDGSKKYYTFDITEQMNEVVPEGGGTITAEVTVEIEDLPLPQPMTEGSGFEPDVSDWEEVNIPIKII